MWGREEGWEGFKEVGVAQVSRSSGRWEWFSELGGASSACIGSGRGSCMSYKVHVINRHSQLQNIYTTFHLSDSDLNSSAMKLK